MLDRALIDSLFPAELPEPSYWEQQYPARKLPENAKVTRFCPSPTGFIHIGSVYVAMLDKDIAHHSGGTYFIRIEDTDQVREVPEAYEQFDRAFDYFAIAPTCSDEHYGPYQQTRREQIYCTYVRELLRKDKAYLCFATREELAELAAAQRKAKVPTGYYGQWAPWRDTTADQVIEQLQHGRPYVVRFRAPGVEQRVHYRDAIRGVIEQADNRNDIVLLKSSDQTPRLPTYHLAHAVDDHLMRVNLVIRGEEWIPSVPLHLQLFAALNFPPPEYAHIAPLMKQDGNSRRKLSKRKDPEASIDFYLDTGYPREAILHYLRGLANGRLAELPMLQAAAEPIQLQECGVAGPLLDMAKLNDISGNFIATMSSHAIVEAVLAWAKHRDPQLAQVVTRHRNLAERAVDIERTNVENPRKDLMYWSAFRDVYGLFFPELFSLVANPADERFGTLPPELVRKLATDFAQNYYESPDQPTWFQQVKTVAQQHGFAANNKEYKANPELYVGLLRDAANVIRVLLTGSRRSPDLHAVAMTLGTPEILRRTKAVFKNI